MNNCIQETAGEGKSFKARRHTPKSRTIKEHATFSSRPVFEYDEAESNYNGRLLTWEITGKRTHHLQENIQMIVDFLNEDWKLFGTNEIIGNSVHNGKGSFNFSIWTKNWKLTFDLKKGKIDKDFFLDSVKEITEKNS